MDQIFLGTALAAALGSLVWFGRPLRNHGRTHRSLPGEVQAAAADVPSSEAAQLLSPEKWLPPVAQTRGAEWFYDVFTPPEIYYDANTQQFAVSRPRDLPGTVAPGVKLVAVERTPFRLQLVGYVGGEGRYLGTFENQLTGEVFLAGSSRPVPSLGLVISDFAVARRSVTLPGGAASNQWVATAVVHDERTGADTVLTAGERSYTDELRAFVSAEEDEDEILRELRLGEEFQREERRYLIERIQLDPPAAELSQISASGFSTRVHLSLTPAMPSVKSAN